MNANQRTENTLLDHAIDLNCDLQQENAFLREQLVAMSARYQNLRAMNKWVLIALCVLIAGRLIR